MGCAIRTLKRNLSLVLVFLKLLIVNGTSIEVSNSSTAREAVIANKTSKDLLRSEKYNETFVNDEYNEAESKETHLICHLSNESGLWEGPTCSMNNTNVPCLPAGHACLIKNRYHITCNTSCWNEHLILYESCPLIPEEKFHQIVLIKFWVDGVVKVCNEIDRYKYCKSCAGIIHNETTTRIML